jgi:putative glutamine amidotransferase
MTARPVLGVIACNRRTAGEAAQVVIARYLSAAMAYADVAALIVPSLPELMSVAEVTPRLDGILLTGTPSNVAPGRYGEEANAGPFDLGRDEMALGLIDRMIEQSKPVFGVCRGFQEINVAFGGTLRRDTSSSPDLLRHHSESDTDLDEMFGHIHKVALSENGLLRGAYGKPELDVISVHYQGIARLADGLQVEATAPDGLIEAFSARPGKSLVAAVQWHPEWDAATNPDSQRFFGLLGQALRGEV